MPSVPKLLSKIKKLLRLSDSDNANEAAVAAAEAARLMQEHKLSAADVSASDGDEATIVQLPLGADGFLAPWKFALVSQVARSFFCEALALRQGRRRKVRIIGRRDDTEVAAHVFNHFVAEIDRLAEEERGDFFVPSESLSSARDYLGSFRRGAVAGITSKLKKTSQQFAQGSSEAMVVVTTSKSELSDYLRNKFGEPKVLNVRLDEKAHLDWDTQIAFGRGYDKGHDLAVPGRDGSRTLPTASPKKEPSS